VSSYGRQFSSAGNLNLWTVGITYRFLFPLGRVGQSMSAQGMSPQGMGEQSMGEQGLPAQGGISQ